MIQPKTNKKSGHPTQPGNRSTTARNNMKKKQYDILSRFSKFFKRLNWTGYLLLAVLALAVILLIIFAFAIPKEKEAPAETPDDTPIYIFYDSVGTPVDWRALTDAWAAEAGFKKRYDLTDAERWEIAATITAEAEGEPFAGKVAVAQCILQACEDDGIRPAEALKKYNYSSARPEPCAEALEVVQAVFDFGHVATSEPIKFFYAPKLSHSKWHESQVYVMTINNHKFFKESE